MYDDACQCVLSLSAPSNLVLTFLTRYTREQTFESRRGHATFTYAAAEYSRHILHLTFQEAVLMVHLLFPLQVIVAEGLRLD